MVRRLPLLLLFVFFTGCNINRKNIIVQKRVFLKGYYVHLPGHRKTFPVAYLPPKQYPTIGNQPVASRPDVSRMDSGITNYYPLSDQQTQTDTNYTFYYYVSGNNPAQQTTGNVPINYSQQQTTPHYESSPIYQVPISDTALTPYMPVAIHDSVPSTIPSDSVLAENPPVKSRHEINFPHADRGVFAQLGLLASTRKYGQQVLPTSFSFAGGIRSKRKINSHNSVVTDLGYRFNQFFIGQHAPKISPLLNLKHNKERVSINEFATAICDRINFSNEEKGKYVDLGMYADWSFRTSNVYYDSYQNQNSPVGNNCKVRTKITDLNFLNSWNYGVTARFKLKYCNVFALYGLNKLVKPASADNYQDFPRLTVGVEVDSF